MSNSVILAQDSIPGNLKKVDSLQVLITAMQRGKDDSTRFASNEVFKNKLENLLSQGESFTQDFSSYKNVSVLTAPDNQFRIFTWVVPAYDGDTYTFFGFIQCREKKSGTIKLFHLQDSTLFILRPESEKLKPERWLGAAYYSILKVKKSGTEYYTLLGWKGKDKMNTQKIIEVLYFDHGNPKFGYPLFKIENVFRNRLVFTFISQVTMTLRYEEDEKMIIFDHLANTSSSNEKDGVNLTAGPDGSYDGLKFKRGHWALYKDVDIRTKWKPAKELPKPPVEEPK